MTTRRRWRGENSCRRFTKRATTPRRLFPDKVLTGAVPAGERGIVIFVDLRGENWLAEITQKRIFAPCD